MSGSVVAQGAAASPKVQESLAAIFYQFAPSLYRYALRLCRDPLEADQIVGDVFAHFLERLAAGEKLPNNLRAYLYQIAYHIIVDHARERQRTTPIDESSNLATEEKDIPAQVEEQMLLKALSAAITNDLTGEQRQVIVLRFQEDLSLRDTAQIMGKDVNAIKALQNRAVVKLQKVLSKQEA